MFFFFFFDEKKSIGLTQFIDFTVRQTMLAKMTKVNEIKNQGPYHPAKDHWKQLREGIKLCCEQNKSFDTLDALIHDVHEKKVQSYTEAIKAFKKFVRNKELQWFDPPRAKWTAENDLTIRANADLGLLINGEPHLIKLFFKGDTEKITARNIQPILFLMMQAQYESECSPNTVYSVLNVKTAKLHTMSQTNPKILQALQLEAQTFKTIWDSSN